MFTIREIESNTDQNRCPKDQTTPIHAGWCKFGCCWPKAEQQSDERVNNGSDVDNKAKYSTHMLRSLSKIVFDWAFH